MNGNFSNATAAENSEESKRNTDLVSFPRAGRPLVINFGSCTWPPFMVNLGKVGVATNWDNMLCCKTTLSILPQFGELRQNFSEVADFVTIYIAEVSSLKRATKSYIAVVAVMIAALIVNCRGEHCLGNTEQLQEGNKSTLSLLPSWFFPSSWLTLWLSCNQGGKAKLHFLSIIAIFIIRPTQWKGVTSVLEGMGATMTLILITIWGL